MRRPARKLRPKLPVAPPPLLVPLYDTREIARFLKPQPPLPIPPRTFAADLPGLLALSLLGHRVVRRHE